MIRLSSKSQYANIFSVCRISVQTLVRTVGRAAGVPDDVIENLNLDLLVETALSGNEILPPPQEPVKEVSEALSEILLKLRSPRGRRSNFQCLRHRHRQFRGHSHDRSLHRLHRSPLYRESLLLHAMMIHRKRMTPSRANSRWMTCCHASRCSLYCARSCHGKSKMQENPSRISRVSG